MSRTFDGTSDYLEHGAAVVGDVPITMACWFKPELKVAASVNTLINLGNSASSVKVYLYIESGELKIQTHDGTLGASATATSFIRAGQWNHGCGVFQSATSRRVFLDGANRTVSVVSRVLSALNVTTIGGRYLAGVLGGFMNGLTAEAAIWNVALDDNEVYLLSRGYYPNMIRPASLVSYWPLVGQYSSDEIDLKGRFDATVFGAKPAIADHPLMIPRTSRHRALDMAMAGAPSGPTFIPGDQPPARIIFQHV